MANFLRDSQSTLLTNLIAYWRMNEAKGSRYDEITPGSGPAGQFTRANSEYLSIADNTSLSLGSDTDFTIACWVYLTSKPSDVTGFVSKWNYTTASNAEYHLGYSGSAGDRFELQVGNGTTGTALTASSFGSPSLNTWYFIVAWHDSVANTVNIQVNNGTIDSVAHTVGTFDTTNALNIGASNNGVGGSSFHDGRISLVGFWKKVLTLTERTSFYNSGNGRDYRNLTGTGIRTSLQAYWNLHEGSGTRFDSHGTNDLTDNNTVTQASGVGLRFQVDTNSTLTTGLTAYWKLDEVSGTRLDTYGANHLTDNNTVTQAVGKRGSAAQFTRANSEYLSIADNAALSAGDIDFTWTMWVYFDSLTGYQKLVMKGSDTDSEYWIHKVVTSNILRFFVKSATSNEAVEATSFGAVSTGNWYFVAAWHDSVANTINIQINNGVIDSVSYSGGSHDTTGVFRLGAETDAIPTNFLDGRLDEVGFWKKVLTAQERTDLYNGGFTNDPGLTLTNRLVSYWKLGELAGTRDDFYGTNSLTDNATVTQAVGKVGNAGQFTAANSEYLNRADNADLSTGDIDFTIAVWVYLDSKPANLMTIVAKQDPDGAASAHEFGLQWFNTSDRFRFEIAGTDVVSANNLGSPATGTWYFIVAWHDSVANTINIQVNDGTPNSTATTTTITDTARPFDIGGQERTGGGGVPFRFWDGRIDEVGFWKKVLTSTERTYLYNSGNGSTFNAAKGDTFGAASNTVGDNNTVTQLAGKTDITQAAGQFTRANGERLSVVSNDAMNVGNEDFTFACWFYIDAKTGSMGLFNKGSPSNYSMRYDTADDRLEWIIGNTEHQASSAGSLSVATWYFVVAWYDSVANTMNIQVNNGTVNSVSKSTSLPSNGNTDPFMIGAHEVDGTSNWDGRIDEFGFWKRVLTADERTELYNSGFGNSILGKGTTPATRLIEDDDVTLAKDLIAYWKLEEDSGSRVDYIGGNTLTDTNTVARAESPLLKGNAGLFVNANSEQLSIVDNVDLSVQDTDFTWAVWVYADALPGGSNRAVLQKGVGGVTGGAAYLIRYLVSGTPANVFTFQVGDGTNQVIVRATALGLPATGVWYLIIGWHDSVENTVNIQINNGSIDSLPWTTGSTDEGESLYIGALNASGTPGVPILNDWWDGRIDEVGFWKRVLTAAERTALYNAR